MTSGSSSSGISGSSGFYSRSSSVSCNPFFSSQISRNVEPHDVEPQDFDNVEDMLFEVFRCEETDTIDSISICQFLKALEATGLRKSDPRLKEMVKNLEDFQTKMVAQSNKTNNINDIVIGRSEFKELIYENIVLISKALRHQFIIPDFLGSPNELTSFTIMLPNSTRVKWRTIFPSLPN